MDSAEPALNVRNRKPRELVSQWRLDGHWKSGDVSGLSIARRHDLCLANGSFPFRKPDFVHLTNPSKVNEGLFSSNYAKNYPHWNAAKNKQCRNGRIQPFQKRPIGIQTSHPTL